MRRFLAEAIPWVMTAILLGYIAADAVGLLGRMTLAVDGKSDAQREADGR